MLRAIRRAGCRILGPAQRMRAARKVVRDGGGHAALPAANAGAEVLCAWHPRIIDVAGLWPLMRKQPMC